MTTTDLTFFTNEPGSTLLDRFKTTLKDVRFFDILVGYFRTSGFFQLYNSFENIEKIRVLVGLNIDRKAFEIIETSKTQCQLEIKSHKQVKDEFSENLINEMENSEDSYNVEIGIKKFIELLKSGKLEIKAYPEDNLHAKVYISRFSPTDRDFDRVITGSSNFSESGLIDNLEFNVELKNKADVEYALQKFEELWRKAVDISEEYVDTIKTKTWLDDTITPYELFLKFLYEYFKEKINIDQRELASKFLPEGFLELEYQAEAVRDAKSKIIEGKTIKKYHISNINKYIKWDKKSIHRTRPDYLWEANEKIILQRISGGKNPITATLDSNKYKTFASVNNIILKDKYKNFYKYILALLNSKLLNWFYTNNFSNNSELTVNISKTFLEQLPIPKISEKEQEPIIKTVDKILAITKENDYLKDPEKQEEVKKLEQEIDQILLSVIIVIKQFSTEYF